MTAFYVPPEVVQAIFASSPGTAAAMWRAAFGLLSATLLRQDLLSVPPGVLKRAVTKARVTSYKPGDMIGPYNSRYNPDIYPVEELVVLMKGELDCPTEGRLIGPCVVVPGSSSMLPAEQRDEFNKLAARVGMNATGDTVLTSDKMSSRDVDTWRLGITKQRGSQDVDARMRVEELVVVVKIALDPAKEIEKKSAWTAHNRLEQLAKLKVGSPSESPRKQLRDLTKIDRPVPNRRMSIQVADIQKEHLRAALRDSSDVSAGSRSGHRRVGSLMSEMKKANSGDDLDLLDEGRRRNLSLSGRDRFRPATRVSPRRTPSHPGASSRTRTRSRPAAGTRATRTPSRPNGSPPPPSPRRRRRRRRTPSSPRGRARTRNRRITRCPRVRTSTPATYSARADAAPSTFDPIQSPSRRFPRRGSRARRLLAVRGRTTR